MTLWPDDAQVTARRVRLASAFRRGIPICRACLEEHPLARWAFSGRSLPPHCKVCGDLLILSSFDDGDAA